MLDEATLLGNLHAVPCFLLSVIQFEIGPLFCHGATCVGGSCGLWAPGLRSGRWAAGRSYLTGLGTSEITEKPLALRCKHRRRHPKLEGQRTIKAGACSKCFCDQVAGLVRSVWGVFKVAPEVERSGEEVRLGDRDERLLKGRRKRSSAPWAVKLSEGLVWKTCVQYTFRNRTHINLQESKARRSLVKRLPRDRRVVICQDSRVNLGALGKGRSPSEALNTIMRTEAPYILGKKLYLAGVHFPTWSIRADAPSRSQAAPAPRISLPACFWPLRRGVAGAGDALDDLQGLPSTFNRWHLFAGVLLLRASGQSSSTNTATGTTKSSSLEVV